MDKLTGLQLKKHKSFLIILPDSEFVFPCFTLHYQTNFSKHCFSMSLLCFEAYSVHNIASSTYYVLSRYMLNV